MYPKHVHARVQASPIASGAGGRVETAFRDGHSMKMLDATAHDRDVIPDTIAHDAVGN